MKLLKSMIVGAAALAVAAGSAYAQTKAKDGKKDSDPGFNVLDKDNDGAISQSEAAGNPELAKKFKEADKDGDGKLSRTEYLAVMTKSDARKAKDKVSKAASKVDDKAQRADGKLQDKVEGKSSGK